MEQNHGTPAGCGRGRPVDVTELRRPITYNPTYAEFAPTEGANTNGMYVDQEWIDQNREASFFNSPSGDHARPQYDCTPPANKEKKPFQLSPYAKEFVPRNFRPEAEVDQSPTEPDSIAVIQLRSFLSEITMCPGKFERKIRPLTDTLNSSVDDDDTMRAVVNIIFDESVRQANLRYSGARLCKALCSGLDPSSNHLSFKEVLLKRCEQEFKRQKNLAQAEDGGVYLRGFAMFMAELYSQLDSTPQKTPLLGDSLLNLIKTIISFSNSDNLKCACQILKLVGAYLEDYERSNSSTTPEMDGIIYSLKNMANDPEYTRNIRDMISSVTNLRENDWGRSGHTENSSCETPPPVSGDEPVMYGPDGKPMTPEELMFLQNQYASYLPPDDYDDVYDDNPGEEMPDEISEAYEVFLRENALRH